VKLTTKASALVKDPNNRRKELEKLKVGDTVSGKVQKITSIGVFVAISGTSVVGLARKHAALDDPASNKLLSDLYTVEDVVRAKVAHFVTKLDLTMLFRKRC